MASDPLKSLLDKLQLLEPRTATVLTDAGTDLDKISALPDDPAFDYKLDPIKAALKSLNETYKKDGSHWAQFKKAIVECKSAAAKLVDAANGSATKKKKISEKAKDVKESNCSADMANTLVFISMTVGENGNRIFVEDTFEAIRGPGKAAAVHFPKFMEGMKKATGWLTLDKWLKDKVKAEDNICFGAVSQPELIASAKASLLEVRHDGALFRTAFLAKTPGLAKMSKALHGMQAFFAPGKHTQVLPSPFGIAEARAVFEGQELVLATQMVGEPLETQIAKFQGMSANDLLNMVREARGGGRMSCHVSPMCQYR